MTRILLVDDDADSRIICRTCLLYSGFTVFECGDGESAIRQAREERPDLILMDLALPRLTGWEAARVLKEDAPTRAIPIVALTANAMAADQARAAALGFAGYLTKPVSPRHIVAEVESQLHRTRQHAPVPAPLARGAPAPP